jgi:AraC-like DNA-binding protein
VSRFLLDVARHSTALPIGQSERVLAHASDLVISLLSSGLRHTDAVRGAVQRSLILRIKDYINQRLWDSTLGPVEVAAAVNISTRYLHKLFEVEHHTVSLYIRARRLDLARRALLDPRLADRSISTIAYSCGFGDLSGFNRAFKGAFGVTPDRATHRDTRHATSAAIATIPPHGGATASGPPCMTWKAAGQGLACDGGSGNRIRKDRYEDCGC